MGFFSSQNTIMTLIFYVKLSLYFWDKFNWDMIYGTAGLDLLIFCTKYQHLCVSDINL